VVIQLDDTELVGGDIAIHLVEIGYCNARYHDAIDFVSAQVAVAALCSLAANGGGRAERVQGARRMVADGAGPRFRTSQMAGDRVDLDNRWRRGRTCRFRRKPGIERQAKRAGSVENDPIRTCSSDKPRRPNRQKAGSNR